MNIRIPLLSLCVFGMLAACAPQSEIVKTQSEMTDLRDAVRASASRVQDLQKRLDRDLQPLQKRLESLETNMQGTVDVQKVMADYGAKSDQLTTDIQLLQGKIEENNYRIAELSQKIDDRSVKLAELSSRIEALETRVKQLAAGGAAVSAQTTTAVDKEKQAQPRTIDPSDAYRQAKGDYDKGNFDLALAGFQNYLVQFPDTSLADKAQYWIGECYYTKKEFPKAIEAFARVVKNYPRSDKAAGAKLKIGLSYLNEKNTAKARDYFNQVIREFPGSAEADLAKDRLSKTGK